MGSAVLFILRLRLLVLYKVLYYAWSGVNRVQVVLSVWIKCEIVLFCFVQTKPFCRYGCMYFLAALVFVCVVVMVMSAA